MAVVRTLLLAGIAGALAAVGRPAVAQIDVKAMSSMDGRCQAEIETRTVACQPFGSLWEFRNGRSLFAFSREGTLYTFSGSRLQPRPGEGFELIVDTVRIASQAAERDLADVQGKCVVQTQANGDRFTAVECDARSPGRNARYKFVLDRITSFERKTFP